ncbi:hypothetical protein THTE_0977 [Thermogutta terrifontis]|uniref:Uncharacterized protein n=1 Tax=Thermogutta terrifontis TaxID=1331910 RepID=A0A286RC94_9BACT|nr:hypothetical protein THTE_0977 [Thermogutta terrifontis]
MAPPREGTLGKLRPRPITQALRERFCGQQAAIKPRQSTAASKEHIGIVVGGMG